MTSFRLRLWGTGLMALMLALVAALASAPSAAAQSGPQPEFKVPAVFDKPMPESLEDLKAIETHVEKVVAKVMPSVVNVKIGKSQGSGVVISTDGIVLTAGHVSGTPGTACTLTFADGKSVKGKSLGQNKGADSGLIKITDEGTWPVCEKGKSAEVKKGQWVIAIGHPGGWKQGRTPPVRLGRVISPASGNAKGGFDGITTECTLVGGDSGGPLFDMYGRVIGIHSRIGQAITQNMHVPMDKYVEEWDRLLKGESWGAGGGGGGKGPKTPPGRLSGIEFADAKELKVAKIEQGSGPEKAGLKIGDLITAVNGKKIATPDEWRIEIGRGKAGDEVTIEVRRGDETLTLKATLDKAGV
jgi:serine protease Do